MTEPQPYLNKSTQTCRNKSQPFQLFEACRAECSSAASSTLAESTLELVHFHRSPSIDRESGKASKSKHRLRYQGETDGPAGRPPPLLPLLYWQGRDSLLSSFDKCGRRRKGSLSVVAGLTPPVRNAKGFSLTIRTSGRRRDGAECSLHTNCIGFLCS